MFNRTHIMLFGLQVTIFGGFWALSTSGGIGLAVALVGLLISGYGLFSRASDIRER